MTALSSSIAIPGPAPVTANLAVTVASRNRQDMPQIAAAVDAIRAHFGPVRVIYAHENGRELGTVSAVSTRPHLQDVPAIGIEEGRQ